MFASTHCSILEATLPVQENRGLIYPNRIEEIISGQQQLFPPASDLEDAAQRYAALIIQAQNRSDGIDKDSTSFSDYRKLI